MPKKVTSVGGGWFEVGSKRDSVKVQGFHAAAEAAGYSSVEALKTRLKSESVGEVGEAPAAAVEPEVEEVAAVAQEPESGSKGGVPKAKTAEFDGGDRGVGLEVPPVLEGGQAVTEAEDEGVAATRREERAHGRIEARAEAKRLVDEAP